MIIIDLFYIFAGLFALPAELGHDNAEELLTVYRRFEGQSNVPT